MRTRPTARRRRSAAAPRSTSSSLHLEDLYAAALDDGASDDEARRARCAALDESAVVALRRHARAIPNAVQPVRPMLSRARAGGRSLNVFSAIRLALRQFRQHPTFALVTVLVLGLGTGAATTVFTVVDSVVLRPLPYAAPDRLVTLWDTNIEKGLAHDPISPVNFMDYRALPVFSDAAAWWRAGRQPDRSRTGSGARQHHRGQRQPLRRARRRSRRSAHGFPEGTVLRSERARSP